MTAEPVRIVVAPGPGSCGTIMLGGSATLAYRFGAGPAGVPDAAVVLTNHPGPVRAAEGVELWVPGAAAVGGADEPGSLRRLVGQERSFVSDFLGGAEVTVLLAEPSATAMEVAGGGPAGSAAGAREDPPFDTSWTMNQQELRTLREGVPAGRPQMKVGGHGNVVKAVRDQVARGRALAEWREESATAVVVLLRTSAGCVLVGSGLDAPAWLALQARHRRVLRDVDVAVVRVSALPLRHLPAYLRSALPRASAVVDAGNPGRHWPACDPTVLDVTASEAAGAWTIEARTR